MSLPFYVSPEQVMKDRAEYARKGVARGRSIVVVEPGGKPVGLITGLDLLALYGPSVAAETVAELMRPPLTIGPEATLREAADLFEQSAMAKRALGEDVVEHYLHFYRTEQDAYDKAVTDWERQRYFERI